MNKVTATTEKPDRIEEEREVSGWQPIETAPRDGTRILVFTVHGDIELSEWYEMWSDKYEEVEGGLYRKVPTKSYEGWNSNMPRYWAPLPEPPQ